MSSTLTFSDLESALAKPISAPTGGRLHLSTPPNPFVAPPLNVRHTDSTASTLAVEVIFLEAPAAVGKSTVADQLSAGRSVPVLNLAKVRVSVGSLAGIITGDFPNPTGAQEAFHRGQLPLIVDALDEGRMFSGEQHIEEFLQTAFEFLLQDRSVTNRPKLIFLGRPEAQALAKAALDLFGSGVTSARLELGYFDEEAARKLVDASARLVAEPGAAYLTNPGPVKEVVDAYFDAIEGALGVKKGNLWSDDVGRAFAGYAPVLGALGHLLAQVTNFPPVVTRLRSTGTHEAWHVIETVVATILEREQVEKFCPALSEQIGGNLPLEAYNPAEQLRFLACHIDGQQLTSSGRVALTGQDLVKYLSMARDKMSDHPFVRHGKIANSVLASLVLTDGVIHGRFRSGGLRVLENESRLPFLWQALRPKLEARIELIDGRYIGCLLNSFWSDPLDKTSAVRLESSDQSGSARITVQGASRKVEFDTTLPVTFFGRMRDAHVRAAGRIRLDGHAAGGAGSTFRIHGSRSTLVADEIEVAADSVILEGDVWLEASTIIGPPRLEVIPKKGVSVGWGGAVATTYPWSAHKPTLPPPPPPTSTRLAWLLKGCEQRFPVGQPIILYADYTPVEDDPHTRWAEPCAADFASLIDLLISHNLASKTSKEAEGPRKKVKVSPSVKWSDLVEAEANPANATPAIHSWLTEARTRIG